jgi:HD-GYP domain-containing protein (c-di-GMP phosphodiesterase class II)
LLGHKSGGGQQFHAINTMTLSLLLGKRVGLSRQALTDLAMAALVHDAGKAEVPVQVFTLAHRNKHEEKQYHQHLDFSLRYATESGKFSPEALEILADHHEAMDGSGWPTGKKNMGVGARILTLVDRYDRLCAPEAVDVAPLVPMEALSTLLRRESSKFDPALIGFLIKLLGIYPPGTLVQLSDGSLGQVVAPGTDSLKPTVLIYDPLTSKEDAQVLVLDHADDLKITAAIRPDSLPQEALAWIKPEQPLAFFLSTQTPSH